jgi:hypothetical protein
MVINVNFGIADKKACPVQYWILVQLHITNRICAVLGKLKSTSRVEILKSEGGC